MTMDPMAAPEPEVVEVHGHPHREYPLTDPELAVLVKLEAGADLSWRRLILPELGPGPDRFWLTVPKVGGGYEQEDCDPVVALNLIHDGLLGPPNLRHGGRTHYLIGRLGRQALGVARAARRIPQIGETT